MIENQVHLDDELVLPEKARKIAIIMHPKFTTEEEDVTLVANFAIDPEYDFEEDCNCYYCGVEECNAPCKVCNLTLCSDCVTTPGCTCMLADNEYVELDCVFPSPRDSKRTTYRKAQL